MNFYDKLILSFFSKGLESMPTDHKDTSKNVRSVFYVSILLLIILLYSGVAAVKIIFRQRLGKEELSYLQIFCCGGLFGLLSKLSFDWVNEGNVPDFVMEWFKIQNDATLYTSAIFFGLLSIIVLVFGFISKFKGDASNTVEPYFVGESQFFGFLERTGISKSTVRKVIEPSTFLIMGLMTAYLGNFFIGISLLICALSFWINLVVERSIGHEKEQIEAELKMISKNQTMTFSKIIS